MSSPADSKPNNKATTLKAIRNIAIAAVAFGALFYQYKGHVEATKQVKELSKKAYELIQRDGLKEYQQAARLLDDALAIQDRNPYAVAARAEVAAQLWLEHGLTDQADVARRLTARAADTSPNLAEHFSAKGLTLLADGKTAEAESAMTDLATQGAAAPKVLAALGIAHARQGKLEEARNDLKQAADRDWRSPRYLTLYGEAFYDSGDFMNAANTFQKALDSSPVHLRARIGRARADLARRERVEESQATIDEVLAATDDLSPVLKMRALSALAEVHLARGDSAAAEQHAREALDTNATIDPAIAYAHYDLGRALALQKKAGAGESFKKAIELYPGVARFYFDGALLLADAGQRAEGEALFELYKQKHTLTDAYHLARGDFFVKAGDLDGALAEYDEALKLSELNPETYYKKGLLFQTKGAALKSVADKKKLYDDARLQYERAVTIRERFPEVYRQMGLIYLDLNPRSSEALDAFAKALNYYKLVKAPKSVFEDFITEVEQLYVAAKLKGNAEAWRKEATAMAR